MEESKLGTVEYDEEAGDAGATSATARDAFLRCFRLISLALLTASLPLSLCLLRPSSWQLLGFPTFLSAALRSTLLAAVAAICLSALLHLSLGCTLKPNLPLAWVVVGIVHVTIGVHAITAIPGGSLRSAASATTSRDILRVAVALVGVCEATIFWSRNFVRQVVDHGTYGEALDAAAVEETAAEKMAVCVAVGLVCVTTLRRNMASFADGDLLGCWWALGTVFMVIGVMVTVRAFFWIDMKLLGICFPDETEDEEDLRV